MADVAARREARRRRILENSEIRLQRIIGYANHDESTEEINKTAVEARSNASNSTPNGIISNEPIVQSQTFDSLINEIDANLDADESSDKSAQIYATGQELLNNILSGQNSLHRRNLERSHNSNEYGNAKFFNHHNSNDLRLSQQTQDSHAGSLLDNSERDVTTSSYPTNERSSVLINILSSRLVYVILAIVVNIMTIFKLEHLFGTSIIVPFFMVMVARLCACKHDNPAQGNNMLVAALILSNCRPDFVKVIQRLKGTFSLVSQISRDLAVYIFTFVLLYNVISPYKNEPEDNLSFRNKAEAIFNDNISM